MFNIIKYLFLAACILSMFTLSAEKSDDLFIRDDDNPHRTKKDQHETSSWKFTGEKEEDLPEKPLDQQKSRDDQLEPERLRNTRELLNEPLISSV